MSDTLKRSISTSVTGNIYSSSRSKAIKAYLEQEGLKSWAEASPALNEAGAETVEVVGPGHRGGHFRTEPFHMNVHVKDQQGKLIKTKNPYTGRETKTWHACIGKSREDLANKKIGSQERK